MSDCLFSFRNLSVAAVMFSALTGTPASASVTMMGSRIIYPSKAATVDVQLKNNDTFPYVVQTWFDEGDVNASPKASAGIPFVATPPVFRIQGKTGQLVRIAWTGTRSLPQDRESVFWFNVLQAPPSNLDGVEKQNRMLVMLRTRVKLFYRPASLSAPGNMLKNLQVKMLWDPSQGMGVEINNPQPWFASVTDVIATLGSQNRKLHADMIAPFASRTFWFPGAKSRLSGNGKVQVTLINDQGSRVNERYDVTFP